MKNQTTPTPNNEETKKSYSAPNLSKYGDLTALTLGKGAGNRDSLMS